LTFILGYATLLIVNKKRNKKGKQMKINKDAIVKVKCSACKKDSGYFHGQFKDIVPAYDVLCKNPKCRAVIIKAPKD